MRRKKTDADALPENYFQLTPEDEKTFIEAKKKLAALAAAESSVLQLELIFFDTFSALKKYDHPHVQDLLHQMRQMHENEYRKVLALHLTVKMRNTAIRTFKNSIRIILSRAINNPVRRKSGLLI
jgi:hypothetical protein